MAIGTRQAQLLLGNQKCDLCDTYRQVIWKCQNCQEVLCEQCKNIHLRSKFSKNHVLTERNDESKESEHSRVFCPDHNSEVLLMFCTTCNCLICLDCVTGKHTKHKYLKLDEVLPQKQKELEAAFDQIKNIMIPSLEQTIKSITEIQDNYNLKIEHLLTEIKTKGEELKHEIERIQRKLTDELMKTVEIHRKYLSETKVKSEHELSVMKTCLKKHEEKEQKLSAIDIILKTDDIKKLLSQLSHRSKLPKVSTPNFHSSQCTVNNLEQMYGQLYHVHVSSFRYRGYVWRIKLFNQDEAWVSEGYDKLKLVDKRGRTVKPLSTKLDIFDMAITNTGDLLVTVTSGFHIKQVTGSGDVVAFANMSPHLPCGIHITENRDVLVGLRHYNQGTTKITRLSAKGKTRQNFEYHRSTNRIIQSKIERYGQVINITDRNVILKFPSRITENKNGDIVVIDFWESVKVIDEKGQHRFTYTGPQQTKTFEPYDIVCNHNEEILVLDHNNKNIQQLDKNGIFISYILTQQERLSIPTALTIDTNGELWIGCEDRQVHIVKYLT